MVDRWLHYPHSLQTLRFSPFFGELLAVIAVQNYGVTGSASLMVKDVFSNQLIYEGGLPCSADGLCWSEAKDHLLFVGQADGRLVAFDLVRPAPVRQWSLHPNESILGVSTSIFQPRHLGTVGGDGSLSLLDVQADQPVWHKQGPPALDLKFSYQVPGLLGVAASNLVQLYDLRVAREVAKLAHASGSLVTTLDFQKYDAHKLGSGTNFRDLNHWDLRATNQPLSRMSEAHDLTIKEMTFSPFEPHTLMTASYDMTAKKFGLQADALVNPQVLSRHTEFCTGVDFSPVNADLGGACSWDAKVCLFSFKKAQHPFEI